MFFNIIAVSLVISNYIAYNIIDITIRRYALWQLL
jgi:hypothetical protein|nr:MAG TPA: hypothetical protein [Caudoviricetes sp.]